jgi:hypothetical protein
MIISNKLFKTEVPTAHPKSYEYQLFWAEQLHKVRAGEWQMGKWMPGRLYYYSNFHHIFMNKGRLRTKVFSLPDLRDLEWEWFLLIEEAAGFSGFDGDSEFTCLRQAQFIETLTEEERQELQLSFPEIYDEGTMCYKRYIDARTYLRMNHGGDKGIPIYNNEAKNFLLLSGRGLGKSYFLSAIILHEWLFDGKPPLHRYMSIEEQLMLNDSKTSIIVGAGELKKSSETMKKVSDAFNRLPGKFVGSDREYPAPFSKQYTGNWESEIKASYKEKIGGVWNKEAGSASKIRNLSFNGNAFAGQGDRNHFIFFEEIGMFSNAQEAFHALEHNMKFSGTKKNGTLIALGTGGDMEGGGSLASQYMFYNPEAFDFLTFNDIWESRGKIAYFVPSHLGLNHYRNGEGIIDEKAARLELDSFLEKKRKGQDRSSYEKEVVYNARVPSEVFMMPDGNIFPILELRERLSQLEKNNELDLIEKRVELFYSQEGINGVSYKLLDKGSSNLINQYPWPDGNSKDGTPVIYEFPIEENHIGHDGIITSKVPDGLYVIGHDPFRTNSENGSLASIVVMKTAKYAHKYGHNEVVAAYYGRPFEGRDRVNEILLQLAMFYNAKVMFENNVGNVKDFFEKKKRLDLLYRRPSTVLTNKDSLSQNVANLDYGYPLSNQKFKMEALQYIRTWLLEERGRENRKKQVITYDKYGRKHVIDVQDSIVINEEEDSKTVRNLDKLYDRRLLQELISYNLEGNFDGVHGLAGCVLALEEDYNKKSASMLSKELSDEFKFISHNTKLFRTTNTRYSNHNYS